MNTRVWEILTCLKVFKFNINSEGDIKGNCCLFFIVCGQHQVCSGRWMLWIKSRQQAEAAKAQKKECYKSVSDGKAMKGFFFLFFRDSLISLPFSICVLLLMCCRAGWPFLLRGTLKENWYGEGNNNKKKYPESKCLARSTRAKGNSVLVLFGIFLLFFNSSSLNTLYVFVIFVISLCWFIFSHVNDIGK